MIDISMPLSASTPSWPGSRGVSTTELLSIAKGDVSNVSMLKMDVHTGTHVDAPSHFLSGGEPIEMVALDKLVGTATVALATDKPKIDAAVLDRLAIPLGVERLLLRTTNSVDPRFEHEPFEAQYSALTVDGAQWVADRGLKLIGIDYLSIQRFDDPPETHRILLNAGVAILEGLRLGHVHPDEYELVCLPLRLVGIEAAPARAILRPLPPSL